MAHILVVDDELGIRELLSEILNDEGHSVDLADCAAAARRMRGTTSHDLVLLDIWMPDTDGLSLLQEWVDAGPLPMPVIMMSGHATIDTAVQATRIGAMGFLEKPIALQKLLKAVEDGLQQRSAQQHAASLEATAAASSASLHLSQTSALGVYTASAHVPISSAPEAHSSTQMLGAAALNSAQQLFNLDMPLRVARDIFEKAYFEYHLDAEGGSMTRVAEKTGLERTHLYRKLRQLGVDLGRGRKI